MSKAVNSNFHSDIANPEAGLDSDLYSAVQPMIDVDQSAAGTSAHDVARIKHLKENIRQGLVGLEYMTGIKKNQGETFYDKHPVQAVGTDILKNSPAIGAGVAAGGIGLNVLRQYRNLAKTQQPRHSRRDNMKGDATHPLNELDPTDTAKGGVKPEISKIFGDWDDNFEQRVKLLGDMDGKQLSYATKVDALKNATNHIESNYNNEMGALKAELDSLTHGQQDEARSKVIKAQMDATQKTYDTGKQTIQQQKQKFINELRQTEGYSRMAQHVDFRRSMEHAKSNGGLKPYIGEGLHTPGLPDNPVMKQLRKLAPDKFQAVVDLMETHRLTGGRVDKELVKAILAEHYDGKMNFHAPGEEGHAFVETGLKNVMDPKHQSSGLRRAINRFKFPVVAGAGIAAGGTGLYHLVKAIQNKVYSEDKTREWKGTLLKSRGDFDQAKKYE